MYYTGLDVSGVAGYLEYMMVRVQKVTMAAQGCKNEDGIYYAGLQYEHRCVPGHQSGHNSRRLLPSSSGASCCFIHRSGTCVAGLQWFVSFDKHNIAYQGEITLHCTKKAMSILLGADDSRFPPVSTAEES